LRFDPKNINVDQIQNSMRGTGIPTQGFKKKTTYFKKNKGVSLNNLAHQIARASGRNIKAFPFGRAPQPRSSF
jgi:hypothetical protein